MPGEVKLLPCPHCGVVPPSVSTGMGEYWVSCHKCSDMSSNRETAIAWWNRRAIPVEESQHVNQLAQPAICAAPADAFPTCSDRRVVCESPCSDCPHKQQAGAQ